MKTFWQFVESIQHRRMIMPDRNKFSGFRSNVKSFLEKKYKNKGLSHKQHVQFALYCAEDCYHLCNERIKTSVKECINLVHEWLESKNPDELNGRLRSRGVELNQLFEDMTAAGWTAIHNAANGVPAEDDTVYDRNYINSFYPARSASCACYAASGYYSVSASANDASEAADAARYAATSYGNEKEAQKQQEYINMAKFMHSHDPKNPNDDELHSMTSNASKYPHDEKHPDYHKQLGNSQFDFTNILDKLEEIHHMNLIVQHNDKKFYLNMPNLTVQKGYATEQELRQELVHNNSPFFRLVRDRIMDIYKREER